MSKTLSTNVTNGKTGDSSPVWLLEVESNASTYRWSTLSTSAISGWSGNAFSGDRLAHNAFSSIVDRCDISFGGNIQETGSLRFKLDNADLYSDTLSAEYFENRRVELRLIFADETAPSWANAVQVFSGVVDTWDWDSTAITFNCRKYWSRHKTIPTKQATKTRYPFLPDENEGKYFGIVFGDFTAERNRNAIAYSGLTSGAYAHRDYIRGLIVKQQTQYASGGNAYLALAEHELHTRYPDEATSAARVVLWDDSLGAFVSVEKDTTTARPYVGHEGVSLTDESKLRGFDTNVFYSSAAIYQWAYVVPVFDDNISSASGYSGETLCVNEDVTDKTTASAAATYLSYVTPAYDVDKYVWDSVKLYFTRDGDETVSYEISAAGCATLTGTITTFGSTQSVTLTGSGWTSGTVVPGLTVPVKIKLTFNQVGGAYNNVYVHHVHLAAKKSIPFSSVSPVAYQSVKGRAYRSWIDGDNHSSAYTAGDLIENPAGVIESILCDDLGLTVAASAGKALDFDGSDDNIRVSHSTSLALSSAFTITVWAYIDDNTGGNGLIRKCDLLAGAGPTAAGFDFYVDSSGYPILKTGNGSSEAGVTASGTITTGTWQHLAVVWDGASTYHYLDKNANGNGSPAVTPVDGGMQVEIGNVADSSVLNARLNGKLDELTVWNRALTSQEIADDYNGGAGVYHDPGTDGIVACWHFDEGTGRTYRDSSGSNNNAGSVSDTATTADPAWAAGKVATTQQIAETNFDTAETLKTSWKLARQITDPQNTREIIRDVCYESGLAYLTRYDGLESLSRIDYASSAITYTTANYLARDGDTTFTVKRGKLSDIYNEFVLYYRVNAATQKPEGVLYVKNAKAAEYDSTHTNLTTDPSVYWALCSAVYQNYNVVNRWEYTAKWIRDDATAELFIKLMINKLTRRPYICEFESTLDLINTELLDVRKLSHPLLPAAIDSTNVFRLIEQEINPNTSTMRTVWIDVGTSSIEPA